MKRTLSGIALAACFPLLLTAQGNDKKSSVPPPPPPLAERDQAIMVTMKRIGAGRFKATCLGLIDRVAKTGEPVV